MNTQEYISSGIVEGYVLGLASPEEAAEFERMCAAHGEVRAARDAFEQQLEQTAISTGVAPPRHLKSQIFSEIEIESEKLASNKPVPVVEEVEKTPVIYAGWWKYVAAVSVILLVASTVLNFYFFNQYKILSSDYAKLLASQTQMTNNYKEQITTYQAAFNILRDTNMTIVKMKGVPSTPASAATVYWDRRSKDVYLMVNNLPKPQPGKQYQLWAIVDGQPVNAGLLNWKEDNMVARMKNIPTAQTFAITLEKEGGSPKPTMDAMYVIGNI